MRSAHDATWCAEHTNSYMTRGYRLEPSRAGEQRVVITCVISVIWQNLVQFQENGPRLALKIGGSNSRGGLDLT